MITPEIKARLAKVYELVKRGTDGEKAAAERLLDKLLDKHNLNGIDLDSLDKEDCAFGYTTEMEASLLARIMKYVLGNAELIKMSTRHTYEKKIRCTITHMDYITLSCAYEYFRGHMKAQWKKTCADELKRCRKAKTKNKRRAQLQSVFFNRYIIASGLYDPAEIKEIELDVNSKQYKDRQRMLNVEGGKYHTQMQNGHLIGN